MTERKFEYYEQYNDDALIITETEIIKTFFPTWKELMTRKFGELRNTENDIEMCIADFCVINWAEEVYDD